ELEGAEEGLDALRAEVAASRSALARAAGELAARRRELAPGLARAVGEALGALGLSRARFELAFRPPEAAGDEDLGDAGPHGSEELEFLLSANPGEDLRPLRLVASGGETARIMLALRTVLGASDRGRTLVFDEIDAGVGGRLGPEVGRHLRAL